MNIVAVHHSVLEYVRALPTVRLRPARASAEHPIPSHSHHLHPAHTPRVTAGQRRWTRPSRRRPMATWPGILIYIDKDEATPVSAASSRAAHALAGPRTGAASCAAPTLHMALSTPTASAPRAAADRVLTRPRELCPYADHRPSGVDARLRLRPHSQRSWRLCPVDVPLASLRPPERRSQPRFTPRRRSLAEPAARALLPTARRSSGRAALPPAATLASRVRRGRARASGALSASDSQGDQHPPDVLAHSLVAALTSSTHERAQMCRSRRRAASLAASARPRRGLRLGPIFSSNSAARARVTRKFVCGGSSWQDPPL